ncbi:MAG: aspartate 1-decarboxylase [Nanoarchaeota archaeon]|nr:aspartate 1-decarboxylase [Nanoarchaeota archaeon]
MRFYLRSKIHKATVTEANVDYIGSITIDQELIEKAGFQEGEKVSVWDITNGERLETYILIGGKTGTICMNGAAAKKIKEGDKIIIAGFELSDNPIIPKVILVDEQNKIIKFLEGGE